MSSRLDVVFTALNITNVNGTVEKFLEIFLEHPYPHGEKVHELLISSLEHCEDFDVVRRCVVTIVMSQPDDAFPYLLLLERHLEVEQVKIITPGFVLGVTLGLIESQLWLDKSSSGDKHFSEELPKFLMEIMFLERIGSMSMRDIAIPSAFEGKISNSMKAYLRPDENLQSDRFAGRMILGHKLIEEIDKRIKLNEGKDPSVELTPLGELLADQISFALFGGMSTSGRIMAVEMLKRKMYGGT